MLQSHNYMVFSRAFNGRLKKLENVRIDLSEMKSDIKKEYLSSCAVNFLRQSKPC